MALIKNKKIVPDTWEYIDNDLPIPSEGQIIVSLTRWQTERHQLTRRKGTLGIRLTSEESAETIADDLTFFDLVALEFPTFKDGRAYSTARLLRERYHYKGELRAVGEVLRDQLQFMLRCGFDAFEYAGRTVPEEAITAFGDIDAFYQTVGDWSRTVDLGT